ncbi:hypothetical protein P280DRAFT_514438 [Massarina eburnea CBS 473.64]|uniref:RRM domain-containing protein n=1 Tax=Massarina eburnea CBS 473.64 TaxID=1395130 RepID=A0A6A6SBN7_9PLEO|nr:hypothetical protein P280DRAFT_514438 [Massarina eburnea CBS 473.64]
MATVTIGKSYFDALLRRAECHTSGHVLDTTPTLSSNVTISKSEHNFLLQASREFDLLKHALFRGGLTAETLETLLTGEGLSEEPTPTQAGPWEDTFVRPRPFPVPVPVAAPASHYQDTSPISGSTAIGDGLQPKRHNSHHRVHSFSQPEPSIDLPDKDDGSNGTSQRIPLHDQRTILITNLSDRSTHKDLTSIIRGGRLLDVYLRSDKSATVSFVEGAAEFLAYAKRNDIYLHQKRLEFRWHERQFHVPPHVSNKIVNGASRNLVVRGAAGKLTADQIRDHLDHIHNLVVIDIYFKNGDAYVSTNSIHNALFARTCCMSRSIYKGLRIDWCQDECAAPLPRQPTKTSAVQPVTYMKAMPITNRYTLLDTGSGADDSDSEDGSLLTSGIRVSNRWADAAVA